MPILNYTTKVDIYTTIGAIQGQLVKHGAQKILQEYDLDGRITALSFMVDTPAGQPCIFRSETFTGLVSFTDCLDSGNTTDTPKEKRGNCIKTSGIKRTGSLFAGETNARNKGY